MQVQVEQHTKEPSSLQHIVGSIQRTLYNISRIVLQYMLVFIEDYIAMGIFSAKCMSTARLDGKTAVITGCNTGIGKITVKDFFQRGAKVIMACRNTEAAKNALDDIKKECENKENCGKMEIVELDLSSLESVRKCADKILKSEDKINILVNNAGIMMCPHLKTKDGYEMQIGTNHLGHFLFTNLLLPRIIQSKPSRIVSVSSVAHSGGKIDFDDLNWEKRPYSPFRAYEQSKLANVLFSAELSRRLQEANIQGVTTYSLHPGVISTDLGRHLDSLMPGTRWFWNTFVKSFIKSPEQGAQTTIHCSVDENCATETGLYYAECKVKEPSVEAKKADVAKRLWDVSCELVHLDAKFNPFQNSPEI